MTNAELIKALRNCSSAEGTCAECSYKSRVYPGTCNGCKWDMMQDAADALEAADKRIAELEAQLPKEGEWVEANTRPRSAQFYCSVCHRTCYDIQPTRDKAWTKRCRYQFCPNCGARMRGEEK